MRCPTSFIECLYCYILISFTVFIEDGSASDDCTFIKQKEDAKFLKNNEVLSRVKGLSFSMNDVANEYSYELSFCTKLDDASGPLVNSGVIQREIKGEHKIKNCGNFNQATLLGGSDWLMLEYLGGDNYTTHCNKEKRRTLIFISCDPDAGSDSSPMIIEENRDKDESCYYLFEFSTKAICEVKESSLSAGSVVIIVVLCLAVLYLLIGVVYKRIALGAKGMEQIPNYEFWKDFGNLQADGCNLVCRSGGGREKRSYKGIGDDQLQDEDDRDDNLLPM